MSISIVTVCLNSEATLANTIDSVRKAMQYGEVKEFIVIDGGSVDGTIGIINSNLDIITWYSSEPDDGISNAFNKGIKKSTSDFILLLNSDDILISNNFNNLAGSLQCESSIYLPVHCVNRNGELYYYKSNAKKMNKFCSIFHPGALIPRRIYQEIGYYDERCKVAMDYDLFSRAIASDVNFTYIDKPLVVFHDEGVSSKVSISHLREVYLIRRKYYGATIPMYEFQRLVLNVGGNFLRACGLGRLSRFINDGLLKIRYGQR